MLIAVSNNPSKVIWRLPIYSAKNFFACFEVWGPMLITVYLLKILTILPQILLSKKAEFETVSPLEKIIASTFLAIALIVSRGLNLDILFHKRQPLLLVNQIPNCQRLNSCLLFELLAIILLDHILIWENFRLSFLPQIWRHEISLNA